MSGLPWCYRDGAWRVALHVQPRATRPGLDGTHGGRLRVRVAAPPADGAANAAVIRLLAQALGVPRTAVALTAGAGARLKTVRIEAGPELAAMLAELAS